MIILGLILLVLGFVAKIPILWSVGIVLLVIGAVLWILGSMGRAVGGRRHYWEPGGPLCRPGRAIGRRDEAPAYRLGQVRRWPATWREVKRCGSALFCWSCGWSSGLPPPRSATTSPVLVSTAPRQERLPSRFWRVR